MDSISHILSKLSASDKLAHGFLFSGNDPLDHFSVIQHLAKLEACERKGSEPCNECTPCNKINHENHPDILKVSAIKSEIVVAQIHELTRWLHVAPNELTKKYAWISDAQNLNASSSNALLKTLEEPPAHAVIFLSVQQPTQAMVTIRSRLMLIRFPDKPGKTILDAKTPPHWLPELEAILTATKKPSLEKIYDLGEQLAQDRDDLIWFLELSQRTLKNKMELADAVSMNKFEHLFALTQNIERNTYHRYGNISLYLDHFFSEWFMSNPMLVDSHAHLDYDSYDADRAHVIESAFSSGIELILNICLGPEKEKFEKSLSISNLHPNIYSAVGVHPHDADRMTQDCMHLLRNYASMEKVVAIGEIGLDYYYDHSDRKQQVKVFDQLLDLALDTHLPVSIHTRDAFDDTYRLLKEKKVFEQIGGIIHCFTGTPQQAEKFLELGAHISFSGVVTFKKATAVAEAAKLVPLDRLLIETDCPFLSPEPFRGKRNEPAYVQYVASTLAAIHGKTVNEIGEACLHNLKNLIF